MVEIRLLGYQSVQTDGAEVLSVSARPKRLALLVYLALSSSDADGFVSRDSILSLFWPESDQDHSRNSLNQHLHGLRSSLGSDLILSHGVSRIGLVGERLRCDAVEFQRAIKAQEWERALNLHEGEFLAGFFVSGMPELEKWLDNRRLTIQQQALDAAMALAHEAEAASNLSKAVDWYRRATKIKPDSEAAITALSNAIASAETVGQTATVSRESAGPGDVSAPAQGIAAQTSHGWSSWAVALIGVMVFVSGAMWVGQGTGLERGSAQFTVSNITQVTRDPGVEFQPSISPDGSDVAYVAGPMVNPRVVVRSTINIGGGGRSLPGAAVDGIHWFPTWTQDGASIRFCNSVPMSGHCDWKVSGTRGGVVRTVGVPQQSNRYAWSPVGSRVAFVIGDSIFVHSEDSAEPELLAVQVESRGGAHSLVWSPNGRQIAYVNGNFGWLTSANVSNTSIWILDTRGGEQVQVTDTKHLNVSPQWLPDSRHLMYVSNKSGRREINVVEVGSRGPRGPAQIIPGAQDAHSISISADGRKLAYAKFTSVQNVRSLPFSRSGVASIRDAVPVTTGNHIIELHDVSRTAEWIAFDGSIRGRFGIYKQPLGSSPSLPHLLAEVAGDAYAPVWSPDGSEVAFYTGPQANGAKAGIHMVTAEGVTSEQLPDFPGDHVSPAWSPDGLAIAFQAGRSNDSVSWDIWITSRDAVGLPWGAPVRLTDFGCERAQWVPDGSGLLCLAGDRRDSADGAHIVLVSPEGEVFARHDPSTAGINGITYAKFSSDGTRVYFTGTDEEGWQGVWWIPTDGGYPAKVVAFDDSALWAVFGFFSVSQDNFYFTIAEFESDIYVMDLEW